VHEVRGALHTMLERCERLLAFSVLRSPVCRHLRLQVQGCEGVESHGAAPSADKGALRGPMCRPRCNKIGLRQDQRFTFLPVTPCGQLVCTRLG